MCDQCVPLQAAVEQFEQHGIKQVTSTLVSSYRHLPSRAHKAMFLDVATLLHGQERATVVRIWGGLCTKAPKPLAEEARIADALFQDLVDASLVTVRSDRHGPRDLT